jgi:hypothetical protein
MLILILFFILIIHGRRLREEGVKPGISSTVQLLKITELNKERNILNINIKFKIEKAISKNSLKRHENKFVRTML